MASFVFFVLISFACTVILIYPGDSILVNTKHLLVWSSLKLLSPRIRFSPNICKAESNIWTFGVTHVYFTKNVRFGRNLSIDCWAHCQVDLPHTVCICNAAFSIIATSDCTRFKTLLLHVRVVASLDFFRFLLIPTITLFVYIVSRFIACICCDLQAFVKNHP